MSDITNIQEPRPERDWRHSFHVSYNIFIYGLTLFSFVVVAGLVLRPFNLVSPTILWRVDFFICLIFFFDFLVLLRRAPKRSDYFFRGGGWLDLVGSVPAHPFYPWMALLRFARLNRFVRIRRHLRDRDREDMLDEARQKLAQTALLTMILGAIVLITVASLFVLAVERGVERGNIKTGADAFWWAFVTVTTVGYGDHAPVTFPGRALAMVLMTFGIGVFAVLTSFVASRVVALQSQEEDAAEALGEEIAIIRAELAEIKAFLEQQAAANDEKGF